MVNTNNSINKYKNNGKLDIKRFKQLDRFICSAKCKKKINISGKKLTEIPPNAFKLTTLQHLDCSYNYLTNLPTEIGQLNNLLDVPL